MIQFKKVIVHNFGSYGHVELELQNRGFCLVSGQNNYIKDNALSNGSGKSFLWSAICYALTGETINGIKSNLKNIHTEEPDCWVQLDFLYNKDLFSLVRTVAPKSDLKIFKNDIDLSGKGIRESEKKLQDLLPELTKDLIASTIIIGQGMPNKFSSFSPSGRKDLLERLTKSDFMIEDLKTRIQARQQELSEKIREFEDSLLANRTQLNGHISSVERLKTSIENQQRPDFDTLIKAQEVKLAQIEQQKTCFEIAINAADAKLETLNKSLLELTSEKGRVSSEELAAYTESYTKLTTEKTRLEFDIKNHTKEIAKLKAIVDTCPTCGQHIPNVQKPSTDYLERNLQAAQAALENLKLDIQKCNAQHQEYLNQIENAFKEDIGNLNQSIANEKATLQKTKTEYNSCVAMLDFEKTNYNKLLYDRQNWDNFIKKQQDELSRLEAEVARLTNVIAITSLAKEDYDQRISIVKKMDQLTKRDFRGFLLMNIINYIDSKAKDYCAVVFGTRELVLEINGNALDITYCGKAFDGLSGGEKQRVDLILQLAIRDLLTSYLGLSANILVLDEITDFLDKKSCQAVMQLLEKELQTVESVFIISHHVEELEIPVDSEIKVVKNEHGISELLD
jgi:DNA repair exonuclease SbcCD ATPase subunit